ncbi:hypothetical protein FQA39_LY10002 [Lamprigera yunnana]|nr:hypothetical protein FQA39_LY10002 [Lamprigera yunnana]
MISKDILILIFLSVGGFCDDHVKQINLWINLTEPHKEQCIEKTNALIEDIVQLNTVYKVANRESFGCYLNCVYEKLNLFNNDHEFNKKALMDTFFYINEEMADTCIKFATSVAHHCGRSYLLAECVLLMAFH